MCVEAKIEFQNSHQQLATSCKSLLVCNRFVCSYLNISNKIINKKDILKKLWIQNKNNNNKKKITPLNLIRGQHVNVISNFEHENKTNKLRNLHKLRASSKHVECEKLNVACTACLLLWKLQSFLTKCNSLVSSLNLVTMSVRSE